jgi:hypothetical protein
VSVTRSDVLAHRIVAMRGNSGTRGYRKALRDAVDEDDRECLDGYFPKAEPDAYVIDAAARTFDWIEIDDCHPTSEDKRIALAWFADFLVSELDWCMRLVIYVMHPVPVRIEWGTPQLLFYGEAKPKVTRSDMAERALRQYRAAA